MSTDTDQVVVEEETQATALDPALVIEGEDAAELPRGAVRLANGSIKLTLRYPVVLRIKSGTTGEVREDRTETLVLHRLTGEHLLAAQSSGGQFLRTLLAKSARMSDAKMAGLLRSMDAIDASAAADVVSVFTGSGPTTGR